MRFSLLLLIGCSYYLMQDSFFTISPLNGVQSADPRLAQQTAKYEELFFRFFSNTQVRTLISQPLDKRCSKASFSVVSQIYAKMWKAIFTKFFLLLETKQLFHNL